MPETYVTVETYAFACGDCGHRWYVGYEAWHSQDPEGAELCVWSHDGHPSMAPGAGIPCPCCGGVRAKPSLIRRA